MNNNKVYGHDLEKYSADEIVEKIGIAKFGDAQLLESFLENIDNIESLRLANNLQREKVYLSAAPTAYEVYKRFYGGTKKHSMFIHPSMKSEFKPDEIKFWADPVAIHLLYKQMLEDGLYRPLLHESQLNGGS